MAGAATFGASAKGSVSQLPGVTLLLGRASPPTAVLTNIAKARSRRRPRRLELPEQGRIESVCGSSCAAIDRPVSDTLADTDLLRARCLPVIAAGRWQDVGAEPVLGGAPRVTFSPAFLRFLPVCVMPQIKGDQMSSQKAGLESLFWALPTALGGRCGLIGVVAALAESACDDDCGYVTATSDRCAP